MFKKLNKVLAGFVLVISLAFISTIAMAATVPAKISGTDVKVRKAPSTSSGIITKLTNSNVTVIDKSNGWYKVTFSNKTGWVKDDYLKLITAKGIINANGVNFRTSPSTKGKLITSLKKNTNVSIVDTTNGWNKVKIGTKVGYVAARFVARSTSNAAVKTTTQNSAAKTTTLKATSKVSRSTNAVTLASAGDDNSINNRIVAYAKEFNGVKYVYGGDNPRIGFDCSGFVGYVYKKFGVELNRSAQGMYSNGLKVSKRELEAGDILFFDASSRKASGAIDHAGIYLGGDTFIHASSSKGEVRIQKLSEYRGTYIGAKRVI